ncbi:hypothetical protein [Persicitalea sp.]|uniref:hypothetical protein n=1 Tax=Persicitalea sp. TaxID=3100273 RepID=UPI00359452E2
MKKSMLIGLFLLAGNALYAQRAVFPNTYHNNIKAGVTTILFGSGDLTGLNYYNEYNRRLNNYLTLAPSVQFGFGSGSSSIYVNNPRIGAPYVDEMRFTKGSAALDLNLYASPWRYDRSKVRLGVGPSLRFVSDSSPNYYGVYYPGSLKEFPEIFDYIIDPPKYDRPQNYLTIGYSLIAEGELNLSHRCNLGARAAFQGYQSGETTLMLGVNFGYRF